jgi:prevent-host-death family protein
MDKLTVRELSRETAAVLDRVERGETIEVTRGRRVVAKVVPVQAQQEQTDAWSEHIRWFRAAGDKRRTRVDPVDDVVRHRRGR